MILDIILALIILSVMSMGFRTGFLWSFLHMAGWILAVVAAFALSPAVKELLLEHTRFYEALRDNLSARFTDAIDIERIAATLPDVFRETITSLTNQAAEAAGTSLSNLFFTILAFLLVIFAVKFVLFLLLHLLSNLRGKGAIGALDRLLGMFMGFVKGAFIVFALLALMIPVLGLVDAQLVRVVAEQLDSSFFAGTLYDNNILVLIVRDFLV